MKLKFKIILVGSILLLILGIGLTTTLSNKTRSVSIIRLGDEYMTVETKKWEVQEDRIRILSMDGKIYNLLYKDVVLIKEGF